MFDEIPQRFWPDSKPRFTGRIGHFGCHEIDCDGERQAMGFDNTLRKNSVYREVDMQEIVVYIPCLQ